MRTDLRARLHFVSRTWDRFQHTPWRIVIQAGLVPISVGSVSASAIVLAGVAVHNLAAVRDRRGDRGAGVFDALESALVVRHRSRGGVLGLI